MGNQLELEARKESWKLLEASGRFQGSLEDKILSKWVRWGPAGKSLVDEDEVEPQNPTTHFCVDWIGLGLRCGKEGAYLRDEKEE